MKITREKSSIAGYCQYAEEEICFEAEGLRFVVKNIAYERLLRIIPGHAHGENSYELHYIDGGQGWIRTSNGLHQAGEKTMYLMGPYEEHAQLSAEDMPMEDYCIYFHLEGSEKKAETPASRIFLQTRSWFGRDDQEIGAWIKILFQELQERKMGYRTCVVGILMQIFVRLVRALGENRPANERKEREAPYLSLDKKREFLVELAFLYDFAEITLEELAEGIGLSCRQTQRFLRENYGKNFQEMRRHARISAAEMLLSCTKESISDIAETVGYSTPEHFADAFRKSTGETPRVYRKKHRINNSQEKVVVF